MSGILNPSVGEVIDRYFIILLKRDHTHKNSVSHSAIAREIQDIQEWLSTHQYFWLLNDKNSTMLSNVHARLWDTEDEVRALMNTNDLTKFAAAARRVPVLNDERARLVRAISALVGEVVPEKTYKTNK